jgi:hypothetical protein
MKARMSLMQARAVNQLMRWMYLWMQGYKSGESIHALAGDVDNSEADGDDEEGHM